MPDEERRNHEYLRRDEDIRWLKVQEQIMNLVTAERTDQQVLEVMKTEMAKLADHVEDLDDHLRGVAGHESMDSRVVLLERQSTASGIILNKILSDVGDIKSDLASIKIHRAINKEAESTRLERFLAWLKFWGPIIVAIIAFPLTQMYLEHRAKLPDNVVYKPDERLRKQIEMDKKSRRAKEVQKKLKALEQVQARNP